MTLLADRSQFVRRAQQYGAALLYAPVAATDPLTNLGTVATSAGALKNGAAMSGTALISGAASVLLDGVNDYIGTNWVTRTNLVPNPAIEVAQAPWVATDTGSVGLTVSRSTAKSHSGSASLKCENTANAQDDFAKCLVNVEAGATYTFSAYVEASGMTGAAAANRGLMVYDGANVGEAQLTEAKAGWQRISLTFTVTAGKTSLELRLYAPKGTVYWDDILLEKTGTLGEYFPTAAQLESGEAGWSGTAHESAADIGPLIRSEARTLCGYANRTDTSTAHMLFGGSPTSVEPPNVWVEAASTTVNMSLGAGVTASWAGAWPGTAQSVFWALTIVRSGANTLVTLYINGVSQGTVTRGALLANVAGAELEIGTRQTGQFGFKGRVLPFAVFLKELSAEQIKELYEVYSLPLFVTEYPPDELSIKVTPPGADRNRWARDEPLPENSYADLDFSDEIPGGPKELGLSLARDPTQGWADLAPYGDVEVTLPGGEVVWKGSLDKEPSETSDHNAISPQALGYQYVLEDEQAAAVGFIDRDLGKWGEPSSKRVRELQEAALTLEPTPTAGFQDSNALLAAILFAFSRLTKNLTGGEAWYYGGGVDLGALLYNFKGSGLDANWVDKAYLCNYSDTNFAEGVIDASKDYDSALEEIGKRLNATASGRKYAILQTWRNQEAAEFDPFRVVHAWEAPTVLGNHGLTLQGTWPEVGFKAKQMLEYLIKIFAPVLNLGTVEDDGFLIPQAWYSDPQSLTDIIHDVVKYSLYDWFIGYSGKKFEYRKPGSYGKLWKAYVTPSQLEENGTDSQRLWRYIVVQYTDVDGNTRRVGPPGTIGAVATSPFLEITDPDHPAVKAGRTRRDVLDLQGISTPSAAIEVGIRFLEEANLIPRSGSCTLQGYVQDNSSIFYPVARVKSGDWISFADSSDSSYRKIVGKQYTDEGRSIALDIDAPPAGLEALLERLQAGLIAQGVS